MATSNPLFFVLAVVSVSYATAKSTYITGGKEAAAGAWPWQGSVQFMFGREHECGAAIISKEFILTAAHCVHNSPFARHLIAGLQNTKDWSQGNPQKHFFYSVNKHPDFTGFQNDLAVVELASPLLDLSNPFIGTVPMAAPGTDYTGRVCVMTGWGATSSGSTEAAGPLQQAEVTVLNNTECGAIWGDLITDGQICIEASDNIGTCAGDSGSPLVCQGDAGWELAGIASFGAEDCDGKKPSVFTRVSHYRDFINKETGM